MATATTKRRASARQVATIDADPNVAAAPTQTSTHPSEMPQSETTALMGLIERAARDKDTDIDRMERLIAMHEKMAQKHAEADFNAAMAASQAEIGPVVAKKSNSQTNSKYADLAAIVAVAQPIIARHGLSTSFGTEASDVPNHYRVTCEVSRGGYSKIYRADIPMDSVGMKGNANKTATHAFGSTMTYGRRYLFCMIFNIATTDDDGQLAGAGSSIDDDQIDTLRGLVKDTDTELADFFRFARVNAWDEIPAKDYARLRAMLLKKREQRAKIAKAAETQEVNHADH